MIQVFKPSIGQAEIDAVSEVLRSGWLGMGPKTAEFEERFGDYVGAEHAIGVNSCTSALHLALMALGIGPGDEVLVPSLTFISTAHAVSYCGARPVFVDILPDTLNLDVRDADLKVRPRTRAIIPVHYGGLPCRMDEIWQLADEHRLAVIEDAAHACGAAYHGTRVGGLRSDATCFSFHAVKNLACGDGGMITTHRMELAQALRPLRWCGISKDTWQRTGETSIMRPYAQYTWYYEVRSLGLKAHMNDITAALGLVQLARLEQMNDRRREIAAIYDEGFRDLGWLECPVLDERVISARHNYVVKVPHRDRLNKHLRELGIATGVHYMPAHLQPCYYQRFWTVLPVTEEMWPRLLTLPMYPDLSDDDVQQVIEGVRQCKP